MFIFTFETVIVAALVLLIIVLNFYWFIKDSYKQGKCEHKDYRETMACDAVCRDCGKNLGFIGTVRGDK